jgi:hypothetical protein
MFLCDCVSIAYDETGSCVSLFEVQTFRDYIHVRLLDETEYDHENPDVPAEMQTKHFPNKNQK